MAKTIDKAYGRIEEEVKAGNLVPFDEAYPSDRNVVLGEKTQNAIKSVLEDISRKAIIKDKKAG